MWNRAILYFAAILVLISLSGCLIIPTDYYTSNSRHNITGSPPEKIIPGTTIREEVLNILGEPDKVSSDESEFLYFAQKVKAGLIIIPLGGGEIDKLYFLTIRFNKKGVVETQHVETKKMLR